MQKYIYLLSMIALVCLFSCKKEDELTPSGAEKNYFLPEDSDTSEEADLKRSFYSETNTCLLFSDTLFVDAQDTVMINFDYNYSVSYTGLTYVYEELATIEEKEAAASFVQEYILTKMGTLPSPYSVLLFKNFQSLDDSYGYDIYEELYVLTSLKTMVINVGEVSLLSDGEKEELTANVLTDYLGEQLTSNYTEELAGFFDVCSEYYSSWTNYATYTETDLYNGFIYYPEYSFYYRAEDLKSYLYAMLTTSEDDFRATYGAYDKVILKMENLNTILKEQFEIEIY